MTTQNNPNDGFLARLSGPARGALEFAGITTLEKLATYREAEILKLHGIGPKSLPMLRQVLEEAGLTFQPAKPKARR